MKQLAWSFVICNVKVKLNKLSKFTKYLEIYNVDLLKYVILKIIINGIVVDLL